jgi:hypothetical protein
MAIKQKDIKLLWGRAANRCSLCRSELSYDETRTSTTIPLGEQAHIVAEEKTGPRGVSILTLEERDSYANLILLCPSCHAKADKAPSDFPVEKLYQIKTMHELWVKESLTESETQDPAQIIYSQLIDDIVKLADIQNWEQWSRNAIDVDARWPRDTGGRLFELQRRIQRALWPRTLPELELAMQTFVAVLSSAFSLFREHCERSGDELEADRFYRLQVHSPVEYKRLLEQFNAWSNACDELLRETARAANWLADVIRRDINPLFLIREGRFSIVEGMFVGFIFRSETYEYDASSKPTGPEDVDVRLAAIFEPYRLLRHQITTGVEG